MSSTTLISGQRKQNFNEFPSTPIMPKLGIVRSWEDNIIYIKRTFKNFMDEQAISKKKIKKMKSDQ